VAKGERKRKVLETLAHDQRPKTNDNNLDEFPAMILREIPQVDIFTDALIPNRIAGPD